MCMEKDKLKNLVSKGLSSKLLFATMALSPFSLPTLKKILYSSGGSGQLSKVAKELEDAELIILERKLTNPLTTLKKIEWEDVFTFYPTYSEKQTRLTVTVPCFNWIELIYKIKLNDNQKKFILNKFRAHLIKASSLDNWFQTEKEFNNYEILKNILKEELQKEILRELIFGENLAAARESLKSSSLDSNLIAKKLRQLKQYILPKSKNLNLMPLIFAVIFEESLEKRDLLELAKIFIDFEKEKNNLYFSSYVALKSKIVN